MQNETPKKKLEQSKVNKYVHLSAEIDKLEKQRLKLRVKLLALMERGYLCPKRGPWLLLLSHQERRNVAWREAWTRLAKKAYGPSWRKVMKQLVAKTPVTKTPLLLIRPNADYEPTTKVVEFKKEKIA
jgi:hypothetical protein